tara:strand:+ start:164 stop:643 length:480 start_codon:yes stop_codon:yes gene_type:complete
MPTLIIKLTESIEQVQLIRDITAQEMRLRMIVAEWGESAVIGDRQAIYPSAMIDLTRLLSSNDEMSTYTREAGAVPYLLIPRPGSRDAADPANPIPFFTTLYPNISFHSQDIPREFTIRSFVETDPAVAPGGIDALGFSDEECHHITLYFDYKSTDVMR